MKTNLHYLLLAIFTLTITTFLRAQCPAGENEVRITFQGDENTELDNSRWEIRTEDDQVLATGNEDDVLCVPDDACYTFTVYDDFGDGLAGSVPGFYAVEYAGVTIAAAVNFGSEQSAYFGGCEPGSSCFTPIEVAADESYSVSGGEKWYIFVPSISGNYEITTCGFNNNCNTSIWIYDRCLGLSITEGQEEAIFYNDDNCEGNQAAIAGVLQAGNTYYLRLGDSNNDCADQTFEWALNFNGEVMGCTDPLSCNYDPLATVNDGSCMYSPDADCPSGPDLIVQPGVLANSIYASTVGDSECYVNEGCLQGYGTRQVVRFTTHIKNIGNEDYVIGSPDPNSNQFEFDDCHGHWHYEGYAEYRLYDQDGLALPVGFKNGFCVLDLECSGGGNATYGCGYMGISAGCGDIYGSGLACQWIDMTELPEGFYTLVVVVNWDRDADLFGRDEVSYDNNWDQVCFQLVRDENNNHNINFINECPTLTDCEGQVQGDAQPDCYGICSGDGKYGDLNVNTLYEAGDISMYLNGILDNTIPVTNCTDLTGNDIIDLEDPAWLMDCILVENQIDGHVSHAHSCQLPTIGITNPGQEAIFSLLDHNIAEQSVVIGIANPSVEMIATHLKMNGLELSNAELLIPDYDAQLLFRPDGQLITFSYNFDAAPRSASIMPFIKIYYTNTTGEGTCLEAWTTINKRLERVLSLTGTDNCLADFEPCSETSPLDSDDDGICDDMDICPGGDDNLDTDDDGIPDFCDACPDSTVDDSDNDGVCDDVDLCIGVNDSLFCQEFRLRLSFDDYPQESSWEVHNAAGEIVASHPLYPGEVEFTTVDEFICLPSGDYTFFMYDSFGDGMCCAYGEGSYELSSVTSGEVIGAGGDFNAVSSVGFTSFALVVADEDNDGVCDPNDQCPGQDDNLDTDGDGIPNGCDTCPASGFEDSDNDGVCDEADICPGGDDNIDTDEDGIPDFCDECPDSSANDTDNDGVCDDFDLCIGVNDSLFCEEYRLQLSFDDYPQESSWEIYNAAGEVVASHPLYPSNVEFTVIDEFFCLPSGDYTFFMYDSFGDGMCCAYGAGSYELSKVITGEVVGTGGQFDSLSLVSFTANALTVADEDNDGVCDPNDQCPGQDDNLDTDGDGIPNGCDTCPVSDFDDSDNDGVCDEADVCPGSDDLADIDNDGTPDACDNCPNSATGDSDLDGVCDDLDQCPGFNDFLDADNDGMPDACDECPNSATGDSDGDSICDDLDQCPGFDDLADADNDGIPDACDDCPNSATDDSDMDGVCDDLDICLGGDDNLDTDMDGQPDFCDICPTLSDNPDVDEDGICDNIDLCIGVDENALCAEVELTIIFDDYATETSWQLIDENENIIWTGGGFTSSDNTTAQTFNICLPNGAYTFTIFDAANDGLCCGFGKGSYFMAYAGESEPLAFGAEFGGSETTGFQITQAEVPDEDQDGVCDPMDVCPGFDDNIDSDEDGVADGCDECPNSATGDSDGDTVCDDLDICPGFDDLVDIDEDGIPDGCDDVINSVENIADLNTIKTLFPNPTDGQLQIVFNHPVNGTIEVVDLFGRKHQKLILAQAKQQLLQLNQLPAGTYLLVFTQEDGRQDARRFVKIGI